MINLDKFFQDKKVELQQKLREEAVSSLLELGMTHIFFENGEQSWDVTKDNKGIPLIYTEKKVKNG